MEVVVLSSEIVKPSSPTPPDLRRLPLSFLDQLTDPNFMTLIFYYSSSPPDSLCLKTSLSATLSRFYPLAGRVDQVNDLVNCNDEGIHYREAKVVSRHVLLEVIDKSQPSDIKSLIPPMPPSDDHILTIQVNFFSCGGVAIVNLCSHKIMDASSLLAFLNAWAAAARNDVGPIVYPKFDMTALFPPRVTSCYTRRTADIENNVVSKRFVFSGASISLLKEKYYNTRPPSLVEALSTFIWTRFLDVHANNSNNKKNKYALIQAVNLRTRMKPNLPASYFGNLSWFAVAVAETDTDDGYGMGMVKLMRESIGKIDGEYLERLKNGDLQMEELEGKQELTVMSFSAMHKFPMKEVDFGMGSPSWVSLGGGLNMRNTVHFLPTKMSIGEEEQGVEAWINLKEEDMNGLEQDNQFLCFASPVSGLA